MYLQNKNITVIIVISTTTITAAAAAATTVIYLTFTLCSLCSRNVLRALPMLLH